MAQQCMSLTVHCTDGRAMYGTNRTPTDGTAMYGTKSVTYIWHSSVWHQQCTVQRAQQCMAPTVRPTDGTNSAPYKWQSNVWHQQDTYRWHSNIWHKQCNVHMAQQCMAPAVHSTNGTTIYGTISAQCYGVTFQVCVAKGRRVIIVRAAGDFGFVRNSLIIIISIQPLGRFNRNQSPVRRPVWPWHAAS